MKEETTIVIHKTIHRARLFALLTFALMGLSLLQLIVGVIYNPAQVLTNLISFLTSTAIGALMAFHVLRFANQMKNGISNDDKENMHEAVIHLENYFKVIGVVFVLLLVMILLGIVISILSLIFQPQ